MKTKFRVLLSAFIVLLLGAMIVGVALAADISVKQASLSDVQSACTGQITYWHFVITDMAPDTAPLSIHVFWSNGAEEDVALLKVSGGVAHYETSDNAGSTVTNATAVVPDGWAGQFNLSHIDCNNITPVDLEVSKTAVPSFTRTYKWTIDKSAKPAKINTADSATFDYTIDITKLQPPEDSNWVVSGVITVSNDNIFPVSGVEVTDVLCPITGGNDLTIPAGGSVDVTYSCPRPDGNPGTNTARATWDKETYGTPNDFAEGSAAYTFADPTTVVNDEVDVTDTNGGSWHFTDSGTITYQMTFDQDPAGTCTDHPNVATITQTGQSDDATVKVCVGAPLTVEKTAAPSYVRTYKWDISKDVTPSRIEKVGGTATFNYTVNAWQTGFEDSDWVVSGVITVSNPNDWEAVDVILSDELNVAGTCELASTSFSVPAGGSVDVKYSCDLPAAADGTNTATATWDKAAAFTLTDSASGSKAFAFGDPTSVVNKTITVTDTFNSVTTTLGTLTATDAQPWASATYKYSQTVPVPTWNCVAYTNVAKIVETGQSDSETVHVCGPTKTGALTMGFWQNKNGQGIISGGASTAGVCNSATWLRQFAPFQDLSATATCTQTATYVFNVIKAANASGTSMNAMLKAQMLATALDVYFSSPTLGGNKIGAPVAIGSVAIDLTRICTDMSCSAYENVAPAFGGATHMTIMQMLTYAAGKSNIGGSTWYGNVKAMQELAKDAFDAINNQKVFAW